ncbi:hypothetical protein COY06_04400, partial [Candidatus Peregrinibacteria bacterium CG_4_10_14_0_2_um_filter_41_8]
MNKPRSAAPAVLLATLAACTFSGSGLAQRECAIEINHNGVAIDPCKSKFGPDSVCRSGFCQEDIAGADDIGIDARFDAEDVVTDVIVDVAEDIDTTMEDTPPDTPTECTSQETRECGDNIGQCTTGTETCTEAGTWSGECEGQTLAGTEICDGIDNNCDGNIDEGLDCACTNGDHQACGSSIGECNEGGQTCDAGQWGACVGQILPTTEICDNKDNDCDGSIDEDLIRLTNCGVGACAGNTGVETCVDGEYGGNTCDPFVGASNETCDNVDNDCDNRIDNVDGLGAACSSGLGICETTGQMVCDTLNNTLECDAVEGVPETEICENGIDEDCNGIIDNGCGPCGESTECDPLTFQTYCTLNNTARVRCIEIEVNTYCIDTEM